MTTGSVNEGPAPVLVLGLGNPLLADDGVGLVMLARLQARTPDQSGVEYLDGGTQGLALAPRLAGRRALLVLDAAAFGAAPGTVHVIKDPLSVDSPRGIGAHEANAAELLACLVLTNDLPEHTALLGVEPDEIKTREGLSAVVAASVDGAVTRAGEILDELLAGCPDDR